MEKVLSKLLAYWNKSVTLIWAVNFYIQSFTCKWTKMRVVLYGLVFYSLSPQSWQTDSVEKVESLPLVENYDGLLGSHTWVHSFMLSNSDVWSQVAQPMQNELVVCAQPLGCRFSTQGLKPWNSPHSGSTSPGGNLAFSIKPLGT